MDAYQRNREAILKSNQQVGTLLQQAQAVMDASGNAFDQWQQTCAGVERQLRDHVVRIAVVGAIKSGKSTFVNALLQEDYLKRGAGVVTSIVTRIRQGEELRARLFFKSWDDINAEIQQALVLFPSDEWRSDKQTFDIRRGQDRSDLKSALYTLDSDRLVVQDSLNANGVLLSSYLKGFDQVQGYVFAESATREFNGDIFSEHRNFVGNDALAVYLKDIELEVNSELLTRNMELADCQGSDSPNPLHLAMIQDYLLQAHLIVYVISSRTGVRQADIRFLSIIKQMGIAGNMLFVCNCDLNEHDSLDDLRTLVQRVKEELALIVDEPQMFTLSALFNLFGAIEEKLSSKDQERLAQWRKASRLISFSDEETRRLREVLDHKLTRERSALLLQNQLARMTVTLTGLGQWLRLNRDLLRRDASDARAVADRLHSHQSHMRQVQSMIQDTLTGAIQKISRELKKEVERFFDLYTGPVLKKVFSFVREYRVDLERYREPLNNLGFTRTLYLVFQELKQAVDVYMAEKINPEIAGFIKVQEKNMMGQLRLLAEPYKAMVQDALGQYADALGQLGLDRTGNDLCVLCLDEDLDAIKQVTGLTLPPAAATMRYSAHIKTEAILRLGAYSLMRAVRKALKKAVGAEKSEEFNALKGGIRRMKDETERSINALFKDYKENIKFQYLQRLAEAAGQRLYGSLTEQFGAYVGDVQNLVAAIGGRRNDKEFLDSTLQTIEQAVSDLLAELGSIRQEVQSLL